MRGIGLQTLLFLTGCCAVVCGDRTAEAGDTPRSGSKSFVYTSPHQNQVRTLRPNCFAIMGMVARPGAYELDRPRPELLELIRAAGGLTEGASGTLRIIRQGRSGQQAYYSPNLHCELLNGDLIVVDRKGGVRTASGVNSSQYSFNSAAAATGTPEPAAPAMIQVGLVHCADYPLVMNVPVDHANLLVILSRLRQSPARSPAVTLIRSSSRQETVLYANAAGCLLEGDTVLVFDPQTVDRSTLPELPLPAKVSLDSPVPSSVPAPFPMHPSDRRPVTNKGLQGIPVVRPGGGFSGGLAAPEPFSLHSVSGQNSANGPIGGSSAPSIPVQESSAAQPQLSAPVGAGPAVGQFASDRTAPTNPLLSGALPAGGGNSSSQLETAGNFPSQEELDAAAAENSARQPGTEGTSDSPTATAEDTWGQEPDATASTSDAASAELGVEDDAHRNRPTGSSPLTVLLIAVSLVGSVLAILWGVNRPQTRTRSNTVPGPMEATVPQQPELAARPLPAVDSMSGAVSTPAPPIAPALAVAPAAVAPVAVAPVAVAPVAVAPVAVAPVTVAASVQVASVAAASASSRKLGAGLNPLDAIIENRLPIDVEPLTLPSVLPIHGRPVNEPVFRLDAARAAVPPAPHFGTARTPHSQRAVADRHAQRERLAGSSEDESALRPETSAADQTTIRTRLVAKPAASSTPGVSPHSGPASSGATSETGLLDRVLSAIREQNP